MKAWSIERAKSRGTASAHIFYYAQKEIEYPTDLYNYLIYNQNDLVLGKC